MAISNGVANIRSSIYSSIRSSIRDSISGGGSPEDTVEVITRNFTDFDRVAKSYGIISNSVTFIDDTSVEIEFVVTERSGNLTLFSCATHDTEELAVDVANSNLRVLAYTEGQVSLIRTHSSIDIKNYQIYVLRLAHVSASDILEIYLDDTLIKVEPFVNNSLKELTYLGRRSNEANPLDGKILRFKIDNPLDSYHYNFSGLDVNYVLSDNAIASKGSEIFVSPDFQGDNQYWNSARIEDRQAVFRATTHALEQRVNVSVGDVLELMYVITENTLDMPFFLSSSGLGGYSQSIPKEVGTHYVILRVVNVNNPFKMIVSGSGSGVMVISELSLKQVPDEVIELYNASKSEDFQLSEDETQWIGLTSGDVINL